MEINLSLIILVVNVSINVLVGKGTKKDYKAFKHMDICVIYTEVYSIGKSNMF